MGGMSSVLVGLALAGCVSGKSEYGVVADVSAVPPPPELAAPEIAGSPTDDVDMRGLPTPLPGEEMGGVLALSIGDAVSLGLTRSFQIARSIRQGQMADLRVHSAQSQYYPRVDTYLNANQAGRHFDSETPAGHNSSTFPTFQTSATASASMPIDLFGQVGHQVQQATLSREDSANNLQQISNDVAMSIRGAYIEAARAQAAVAIDQAVVVDIERILADARKRVPDAVEQLETELETARDILETTRSNAELSLMNLRQLLRLQPQTDVELTTRLAPVAPIVDEESLIQTAMDNRPDVRSAQVRLAQAELAVEQITDGRKPTVYINAFYNGSLVGSSPGDAWQRRFQSGAVMLNVNVPLWYWDRGQLKDSKQIAMLARDQALDDMQEQRERIANDIRQQIINMNQARIRLASLADEKELEAALREAEDEYFAARPLMARGLVGKISGARNQWRQARIASLDTRADLMLSYYQLRRATGQE